MQIIGILDSANASISSELSDRGFRTVLGNKGFKFFADRESGKKDYWYYRQRNVHLVLMGYISDEYNSTEDNPENIAAAVTEAYFAKGIECFNRVDGSYIIIIWDGERETLYLNRDIYGTRLLYFHFSPRSGLVFSSNLNLLLRLTNCRNISRKACHEYLRFLDIAPPYTIYENIYFLESEKILICNGTALTQKTVLSHGTSGKVNGRSLQEVSLEFHKELLGSIERRVKNSQKIGVLLSGGIDSSLICATASGMGKSIRAYTVGFDEPRYDESGMAREIADHLGIEHKLLKFTMEDDYKSFNDVYSHMPSPFADPAVIPTFGCLKHISDTVDSLLEGTGADSLIGIMPARHIRFILKYFRHIPYKMRMFLSAQLERNKGLSSYEELFNFTKIVELLIRWNGWTEEEISLLCGEPCDLSHTKFYRLFAKHSDKEPYELYSTLIGALPDDRIHQTADLFELNVIFPFFDNRVQNFVRNLPMQYKYCNEVSKVLFRQLLSDLVPLSIWKRPKHGFDYPFENLLRYGDYTLPRTLLAEDLLGEHNLFDPAIVDNYLQDFLKGDDRIKFKIWALVVFQAWYMNYYKPLM